LELLEEKFALSEFFLIPESGIGASFVCAYGLAGAPTGVCVLAVGLPAAVCVLTLVLVAPLVCGPMPGWAVLDTPLGWCPGAMFGVLEFAGPATPWDGWVGVPALGMLGASLVQVGWLTPPAT